MQQSSSSIGGLAAALAKAQVQLVNPEKSMIATIRADDKGGAEQIFQYAPLSSGLEILRKTLGQHEIAILQATAIDQAAGLSISPRRSVIPAENGWGRLGPLAQLTRWRALRGWGRLSLMRGVKHFSHSRASRTRTISMLLTSTHPRRRTTGPKGHC